MAASCEHVVETIIADSGAFLRNAQLQNIGDKIFSIPEVVNEIRDKATKQRLEVLPYEIEYRQPSVESIKFVTDFSKKTGDYGSLSAVDIRVMALSYQLEKEFCGDAHIRKAPEHKAEFATTTRIIDKPTDLAGFYLGGKEAKVPRTRNNTERTSISSSNEPITDQTADDVTMKGKSTTDETPSTDVKQTLKKDDDQTMTSSEVTSQAETEMEDDDNDEGIQDGEVLKEDLMEEESDEEEEGEEEEEESDDDGGGWITPANIQRTKMAMMQNSQQQEMKQVKVACLTTDFAMQNVLLQMGLNVLSVDGLLIKRARSFVLRCHACMKITKNMMKQFCPHCGNHTLKKVSVTVNEDGTLRYYLSKRKPINTRGMRFSLPKPKGGKHSSNPQLVADQPMAQQRPTKKSLRKMNALDPDYAANTSPFSTNDVTSRAAMLGIRVGRKNPGFRNPNMNRRGRRK